MNVEYINPFVSTTVNVFATMASCPLTRVGMKVKEQLQAEYEVSGIIGLSGRAAGTVILSLSKEVALGAASAMMGEPQSNINRDVLDVIAELTNMVAGGAKTQLAQYEMSISLPNVIIGKDHVIYSTAKVKPISILFESPMGPVNVDVSLVEQPLATGA